MHRHFDRLGLPFSKEVHKRIIYSYNICFSAVFVCLPGSDFFMCFVCAYARLHARACVRVGVEEIRASSRILSFCPCAPEQTGWSRHPVSIHRCHD